MQCAIWVSALGLFMTAMGFQNYRDCTRKNFKEAECTVLAIEPAVCADTWRLDGRDIQWHVAVKKDGKPKKKTATATCVEHGVAAQCHNHGPIHLAQYPQNSTHKCYFQGKTLCWTYSPATCLLDAKPTIPLFLLGVLFTTVGVLQICTNL
eukprot:TRINITY_DN26872_c0_g1_i1.p1 TRINITY_DN26872_c0_g1~~TRINITY_DN26872_c0_g1_i1.p1  ORF type:complete len:151 (+),score=0.91 TRINITY_DN26872_c0_g1_i1:34-486(+)